MTNDRLAGVVRAAANGDEDAWTGLVRQHRDLLRNVARGYRLSEAQVDDVVQTAWLRLVEHLGSIRDPERVTGWLVTTVRRECLSMQREQRREQPTFSDRDQFWGEVGSAEDDVLREAECLRLRDALRRLPVRQREVMTMLIWRPDLGYQAVGAALGMPVGSIGPTRGRAMARLRLLLDSPAQPSPAREGRRSPHPTAA